MKDELNGNDHFFSLLWMGMSSLKKIKIKSPWKGTKKDTTRSIPMFFMYPKCFDHFVSYLFVDDCFEQQNKKDEKMNQMKKGKVGKENTLKM